MVPGLWPLQGAPGWKRERSDLSCLFFLFSFFSFFSLPCCLLALIYVPLTLFWGKSGVLCCLGGICRWKSSQSGWELDGAWGPFCWVSDIEVKILPHWFLIKVFMLAFFFFFFFLAQTVKLILVQSGNLHLPQTSLKGHHEGGWA